MHCRRHLGKEEEKIVMQRYFEHLLNLVYREYCPKITNIYGKALPFASSYIKFGGFNISLDWYGKTSLAYERLGNIHLITKTIFFNIGFLYHLAGWQNHQPIYNLKKFINTIAHEVAHCLRADFDPTKIRKHDK